MFVHGCFWHAHAGCPYFKLPKTREVFWHDKLAENAARDRRTVAKLREAGWRVAIVWECALRKDTEEAVRGLHAFLTSDEPTVELAG